MPVEDFIDYGTWFKERAAPNLDARTVVQVAALHDGFRLVLDDGKNLFARRVVMATGRSIMSTGQRNSTACRAPWLVTRANIRKPATSGDAM
jgi:hypothetical protein